MGKFGVELRNDRGNIKKVQNHEYHVSEESREEMDLEKPKRCDENRNWQHPNKQAIHLPIQLWKWSQNNCEQH